MKQIKLLILLVSILAMQPPRVFADQITHTVTYDPSKLTVTYDTIDGNAYARVEYKDLLSLGTPSEPLLPCDNFTISVPYNASNFNVQCQINSYVNFDVLAPVLPSQMPRIISDTVPETFTSPNNDIYQLNAYYPYNQGSVCEPYYLFGCNKVINIYSFPFRYNPVLNKLQLVTSMELTLSYETDSYLVPFTSTKNLTLRERNRMQTAECVINKLDVAGNELPLSLSNTGTNYLFPTYNYCIITDKNLEPSFKKIIAMKRQKGLSAGTVCVEDIVDSGLFSEGDKCYDIHGNLISTNTDTAGFVRQYLKYASCADDNPTVYLLFGGKSQNIPIRFVKSENTGNYNSTHVPTDMYFSDLTQIWKHNNSQYFDDEYLVYNQSNTASFSFSPKVYVGRLLAENREEVSNYSDKLYRYTYNPCHNNSSYLLNAFFSNARDFKYNNSYLPIYQAEEIFSTVTLIEQSDSIVYPTGAYIINALNNIKYGYVSFHAHGDTQSIAVYDTNNRRHVISSLDSDICNPSSHIYEESGNGLDCLTNKYEPAIGYSVACTTMPFDNPSMFHSYTYNNNKYNFGQSFTLGKSYGGVAYLGNTRYGYTGASPILEYNFLKTVINTSNYKVGVIEALSKILYPLSSVSTSNKHIALTHNLLGDPEFEMWTSIPQQYLGLSLDRYASSFSVNGVTPSDTIAYCDNDCNVGRIYGESSSALLSGISHNSLIMVYNHDHIPYIFPLMLQNCDINNSQYVYASSFLAGNNIQPGIKGGNVTIKSGAVYEIEATDEVMLNEGFIVEGGATFNVKTPGKVTIDGCVFQSGAKVKIEAGNVEFVSKFTAERGAKVEFTEYVDE